MIWCPDQQTDRACHREHLRTKVERSSTCAATGHCSHTGTHCSGHLHDSADCRGRGEAHTCTKQEYTLLVKINVQSNLDYPNLNYPNHRSYRLRSPRSLYPNPRLSKLKMQRKYRVKVYTVTARPGCTCAVNRRWVVPTQESAAVLLSNLVLTLKEVKKC